jgi:hypothetical protein
VVTAELVHQDLVVKMVKLEQVDSPVTQVHRVSLVILDLVVNPASLVIQQIVASQVNLDSLVTQVHLALVDTADQ